MAKTGGARPNAGRPMGSLSKRHVELVAGAASVGLTPVEFMLATLRDENADPKDRAWAAEKAAPYVHPRPAPIQRTVSIDLPAADTADGVKAALACLIKAAANGELSPVEAQSFATLIESQRKAIETADILDRLEKLERKSSLGRAA